MRYCDHCGIELRGTEVNCPKCSARLDEVATPSAPAGGGPGTPVVAAPTAIAGHPYKMQAIGVACLVALLGAMLIVLSNGSYLSSGALSLGWLTFVLVLWPLAGGATVVAAHGASTPSWLSSLSGWMDRRRAAADQKSGHFNDWVVRPVLWCYEKVNGFADNVRDDVLRNGARAASFAFTVGLFAAVLYVLTVIVITVVILAIFGAIFAAIISSQSNESETEHESRPSRGPSTIYSGSNVFNEDVSGRVDAEGNIYKGTNMFNEEMTGRVDAEGNVYQGTNMFNEEMTGRVDADGNVFKGANVFTEEKVGRVDSEGNAFKGTNVFTEEKVGRIERKDG